MCSSVDNIYIVVRRNVILTIYKVVELFYSSLFSTMKKLHWIAVVLLIIGGINWGLVGAFGFNLIETLFNDFDSVERAVYVFIGLSALWRLHDVFILKK